MSYTPSNPLLATFAIFIGLLLWFRVNGVVMLVASSWIAVAAQDRDQPLLEQTEAERRLIEYETLLTAARIRVREAREARDAAPWFQGMDGGTSAARRGERARGSRGGPLPRPWIPPPPSRSDSSPTCTGRIGMSAALVRLVSMPHLRIATVNVNGIRAAARNG